MRLEIVPNKLQVIEPKIVLTATTATVLPLQQYLQGHTSNKAETTAILRLAITAISATHPQRYT
jgi:hypothetical protein